MSQELLSLIANGESASVEFKESFHDDALETIGAFSNALGGTLFIGVQDSGQLIGVQIGKKTIEDLSNKIQTATEPRIQPSIDLCTLENKSILVVQVSAIIGAPISIRGRYFRRTGKTNQRMSHEEIMQRLLAKSGLSWDSVVETSSSIDDLEPVKIKNFLIAVKNFNRRPFSSETTPLDVLRKIGLIERTQPTRAALLLFGKKINHFFPSAFLKIGRFRSPTHIVDDLEIHDTLFEQVEGTMMWLRQKLETEFIISGKPQRDIRWEFPLGAIREALINAICHRDYSSLAHTQIRLYDDRLEIRNAGELPPTLTPEILFKDHDSMPRNSKIADAFFCAGLIEKWGSGTTRIVEELHAAKMPPPEFVSEMGRFLVRFHKEESLDKFLEKQNLSARQLKAVSYIKQHGKISNSKYRELLGVSKPTASKELQDLKIKGILGSTGTKGPGSSYHLKGSIGL